MNKWATLMLTEREHRMLGMCGIILKKTIRECYIEAFEGFAEDRRDAESRGVEYLYRPTPRRGRRAAVRIDDESLQTIQSWAERDNVRHGAAYYTALRHFLDHFEKEYENVYQAI